MKNSMANNGGGSGGGSIASKRNGENINGENNGGMAKM
jgi:hypothetical protein